MLTRQSIVSKVQSDSLLIDSQKLRLILSKKLQKKVSNPEEIIKDMEDQFVHKIQKTQDQISRQINRQQRIKKVEQEELRIRSLLNDKIFTKIQKSSKKKQAQEKEKLQKKVKVRKIKEELIDIRLKQIKQAEFKERIQKFRAYKSQNSSINQNQEQPKKSVNITLLGRSNSIKSNIQQHIAKSKQLEELSYFKIMEKISKRKIYDKPELKFRMFHSVNKLQISQLIKSHRENKSIQTLGKDLASIDQARTKKEKNLKDKLQKLKKQKEIEQEQLLQRMQNLKQLNIQKMKNRKQSINKKNERFATFRNNSTPLLKRNLSSNSENSDFERIQQTPRLAKTFSKINFSSSIRESKADEYLQKDKEFKMKRQAKLIMQEIIKEQKISLMQNIN